MFNCRVQKVWSWTNERGLFLQTGGRTEVGVGGGVGGLKLRSLASRSDFEWRVKKEGTFVSVGRAECE